MREIDVVFDPERKLFLYFGVAFLAIGVGPFGTYEAMSLWERTVFWMLDVLGSMVIIVPVLHVFYDSRLMTRLPSLLRFGLGVALGALPAAGFITLLYGTIGSELEMSTTFPVLYAEVTVFSCLLLLAEFILWPMVFGTSVPAAAAPVAAPALELRPVPVEQVKGAPLLMRLPPAHRNAAIISISMQDHYAEVTTTAGPALILMRLNDAIDLLKGCPGARIQRSHWVAKDFVAGIERNGRRVEVRLQDGRMLPVGATYLKVAQRDLGLAVTEAS